MLAERCAGEQNTSPRALGKGRSHSAPHHEQSGAGGGGGGGGGAATLRGATGGGGATDPNRAAISFAFDSVEAHFPVSFPFRNTQYFPPTFLMEIVANYAFPLPRQAKQRPPSTWAKPTTRPVPLQREHPLARRGFALNRAASFFRFSASSASAFFFLSRNQA